MPTNDKRITVDMLNYFKTKQDALNNSKFVAQQTGYSLSENDFDSSYKSKLDGIAAGAQVNVIETVNFNGTALIVSDKTVSIDLTDYALKSDLTSVYKFQGTVSSYSDLPADGQTEGDVYNITNADAANGIKAGDNVAWNGESWDNLSGILDLSNYVTSAALNTTLTNYVTNSALTQVLAGYTDNSDPQNPVEVPGYVTTTALGTALDDYTTTTDLVAGYVQKDGAKVLSDNNFTTALKTKLENIEDATTEDIDALFTDNSSNNDDPNSNSDPSEP